MVERSTNHNSSADRVAGRAAGAIAQVAWHSLAWLVVANAVGVLLATLLLFPKLNALLGEWTYGRWMMVHMNLELYGWASLPLVGFLFHVYIADNGTTALWCRPILWVWSAALGMGTLSWLTGHSSGKLFLDWSGYARILFAAALLTLWLLLVIAWIGNWVRGDRAITLGKVAKLMGLAVLLAVPFVLFIVTGPNSYPPINPATGGPTGASQLESSLAIVLIMLLLPMGIAQTRPGKSRVLAMAGFLLVVHGLFCAALGRADVSHHVPLQFIGLGTILIWLPIMSLYYRAFEWHRNARRWRQAVLWWWAALLVSGTIMFLPGVLDHFKFTDGLVGHSFVAMAGFASSLIVLVMVQLLGDGAWIFNRSRAFYGWHGAVIAYIIVVTIAGWREGFDPAFTIVPGMARDMLYALRLITGIVMLLASIDWLIDSTVLLRNSTAASSELILEETA